MLKQGSRLSLASIAIGCVWFFFSDPSPAASLTKVGELFIASDTASHVTVNGSFAFLATANTLKILDASDPHAVRVRSQLPLQAPGPSRVVGNFLYTVLANGFQVTDISNPDNPQAAGFLNGSFYLSFLVIDGQEAFVAGPGGVSVIDIANPAAPSIAGTFKPGNAVPADLVVRDGLAFSATATGFTITDITDLSATWTVASYSDPNWGGNRIALKDNLLAVSGSKIYYAPSIRLFDLSNLVAPQLKSIAPFGASTLAFLQNGLLMVGFAGSGYGFLDVSNPSEPVLIPGSETMGNVIEIEVHGNVAYIADGPSGLVIMDISTAAASLFMGSFQTSFHPLPQGGFTVSGGYAYVPDTYNGVEVFDIRTPSTPVRLTPYWTPLGMGFVHIQGNRGYFGNGGGFDIVDISNPAALRKLGEYRRTGGLIRFAAAGQYIYTSIGTVIDVSNPASPIQVGSFYNANTGLYEVSVSGNFLYATDTAGHFDILDLSSPKAPLLRSQWPISFVADFIVTNGFAYLFGGGNLFTFSVSNPDAIALVSTRNIQAYAADGGNDRLFHTLNGYLYLDDMQQPESPAVVANILANWVDDLASGGNFVCTIGKDSEYAPTHFRVFNSVLDAIPPSPKLSVSLENQKAVIRWPSDFPNMKLYSFPNLGDPWTLVTSNPFLDGSTYVFTNTRPVGASLFYKISSQ